MAVESFGNPTTCPSSGGDKSLAFPGGESSGQTWAICCQRWYWNGRNNIDPESSRTTIRVYLPFFSLFCYLLCHDSLMIALPSMTLHGRRRYNRKLRH